MSISISYKGRTFSIPTRGESDWDTRLNAFLREIGAPDFVELKEQIVESAARDGYARLRSKEGRPQGVENAGDYKSLTPGADVYDIRDLGTGGVMLGNSTKDTEALQDAVAVITSSSTSTNSSPGHVKFPRGELLLATGLSLYGGVATASAWAGAPGQGRSKGNDGTSIKWVGADKGVMIHSYGLNGCTFKDLCLDGGETGNRARFPWWAESNERNGGSPSSDNKWIDCLFTDFGHHGVGFICGDEVRAVVTIGGVVGTFTPGELVLDSTNDAIATVVSHVGASLSIKEVIGGGFSGGATSLVGLTSGATATGSGWVVDSNYQGNRQFSEGVWDTCYFRGTGLHTTVANSGWSGWATFGANNNKDYKLVRPGFYGTRYCVDGWWGSGYLTVTEPTGGIIGHAGKGAYLRAQGSDVSWKGANFENTASTDRCRIAVLQNVTGEMSGGSYFGLLPADDVAIDYRFGSFTIGEMRIGSDSGNPGKIVFGGGSLRLNGTAWREDFSGYIPLVDSIGGNELGRGDYSRNNDFDLSADGCIANCNGGLGGIRKLPNIIGTPLSPQRNQLWDDSLTANSTVVRRGALSCSVESRTIGYAAVIAGSGAVHFAKTKGKAVVRGIVWDLTTTFRGGAISAMTLSVGNTSSATAYKGAVDVFTAAGQASTFANVLAPWAGDDLVATFTPTGAAIAALTQGSVTVYVLYEVL